MSSLETLAKIFERFPGIGPRQAGRFVQFLLRASPSLRRELAETIRTLAQEVHQCSSCMRFAADDGAVCRFCIDPARDRRVLALVISDADLAALERSGYKGQYFVLGGTISLATENKDHLRLKELSKRVMALSELQEIMIAFPANPEGDFTATFMRSELPTCIGERAIKVSTLGRGLSTGSELEYADQATIQAAIEGRH